MLIGDRDVTEVPPQERDVAMVFQSYALYPHMTVRDNLGFGLRMRGTPPDRIAERVDLAAKVLGLAAVLDRKPGQLSGGQRQRVALGRAIVREPMVFLFDEPLSNLDAKLRVETRAELARLHRRLGRDHRLRHPRPGGGADAGDAGGGDERGKSGAGGSADRGLPPARRRCSSPASSARRP